MRLISVVSWNAYIRHEQVKALGRVASIKSEAGAFFTSIKAAFRLWLLTAAGQGKHLRARSEGMLRVD